MCVFDQRFKMDFSYQITVAQRPAKIGNLETGSSATAGRRIRSQIDDKSTNTNPTGPAVPWLPVVTSSGRGERRCPVLLGGIGGHDLDAVDADALGGLAHFTTAIRRDGRIADLA
jgi:hypothetical protein